MLTVLCSGTLAAEPRERQSASGKPYATALLRVPCEDSDAVLVSVISFNAEVVAAILALSRGDSCAVAGRAKLNEWTGQDGTEKRGLSVVVDKVLTAYQIDKRRRHTRGATQDAREEATA